VGQEWEQSGNKVGTRMKVGQEWEQSGNKVGTQKDQSGNKNLKMGQDWEQGGNYFVPVLATLFPFLTHFQVLVPILF